MKNAFVPFYCESQFHTAIFLYTKAIYFLLKTNAAGQSIEEADRNLHSTRHSCRSLQSLAELFTTKSLACRKVCFGMIINGLFCQGLYESIQRIIENKYAKNLPMTIHKLAEYAELHFQLKAMTSL